MSDFKPNIIGFLCNWCAYAGADLAGVSRLQYPPNIRIIRVMCSGRVDPMFIIEAFLRGADGVMVLGCHPADCHYSVGNYEAVNMSNGVGKLLEYSGANGARFLLQWVSAAEGTRFAEIVRSFTTRIEGLGPLGMSEKISMDELLLALQAARRVAESEKFRWVLSKQTEFRENGNKYGERFTRQEMNRALESTVIETLTENKILIVLEEKPLSIKEIAAKINLSPSRVLRYITALRRKEAVSLYGIEGAKPLYCLTTTKST